MSKITSEDYEKAREAFKRAECRCSKCGIQFRDRWEWSANALMLRINVDCQSTEALFGDKANEIGFKHPAIQKGAGYQELTIASGRELPYRLCPSCHRKFVRMVGNFLRNDLQ
jgi:hypothetical protein